MYMDVAHLTEQFQISRHAANTESRSTDDQLHSNTGIQPHNSVHAPTRDLVHEYEDKHATHLIVTNSRQHLQQHQSPSSIHALGREQDDLSRRSTAK